MAFFCLFVNAKANGTIFRAKKSHVSLRSVFFYSPCNTINFYKKYFSWFLTSWVKLDLLAWWLQCIFKLLFNVYDKQSHLCCKMFRYFFLSIFFFEVGKANNLTCTFTKDCEDYYECRDIQDAGCVCNLGECVITGLYWFEGPYESQCDSYEDCSCKFVIRVVDGIFGSEMLVD